MKSRVTTIDESRFRWLATRCRWALMMSVVGILVIGCGTGASSSSQVSSATLDGGMRGLAVEDPKFWRAWTPRQPVPMEVDESLRPPTVFDAWRIDDPEFREPLWDATFHLLSALDVRVPAASRAVVSLMLRLEPGYAASQWEVAFISQGEGQYEGLVLRMATEKGAGLWVEAIRRAGDKTRPFRWILRVEPAAQEVPGWTVWWDRDASQGWRATIAEGARAPTECAADCDVIDADWEPLIALWESALWRSVTERQYLEPSFERRENVASPLGPGWPVALGETLRERGLRDFVEDTVFVPRTTDATPEHF